MGKDAEIGATVAIALTKPPTNKAAALLRSIEVITRHLKGVVASLEELREELKR